MFAFPHYVGAVIIVVVIYVFKFELAHADRATDSQFVLQVLQIEIYSIYFFEILIAIWAARPTPLQPSLDAVLAKELVAVGILNHIMRKVRADGALKDAGNRWIVRLFLLKPYT